MAATLSMRACSSLLDGTIKRERISRSLRCFSSSMILTGYCSPASRYVVISSSPLIIRRTALATSEARTPNSAARAVERDAQFGVGEKERRFGTDDAGQRADFIARLAR